MIQKSTFKPNGAKSQINSELRKKWSPILQTEWLPFCRWHFRMHFAEWEVLCIDSEFLISLKYVSEGLMNNKYSLVRLKAWGWASDKPLLQLVIAMCYHCHMIPHRKAHGANMGPTWGRHDPDGPHVGPMNFAIWDVTGPFIECCNIYR